ncbi:MAG: response regulator [Planctomycetaceae bacterium]
MSDAESSENRPFGILLSQDLFFGSKVTGTAQALGLRVESLGNAARLAERLSSGNCRSVLIDLAMPGLDLAEIVSAAHSAASAPRVIAFGAHVQTTQLEAARDAGCDEVMPRSKFSATLPDILRASLS